MKKIFDCDENLLYIESREEKDKSGFRAKFVEYDPNKIDLGFCESIFIKPKKSEEKSKFEFVTYSFVDDLSIGM